MKSFLRGFAPLLLAIGALLFSGCPGTGPDPVNSSTPSTTTTPAPTATPTPLTDAQAVAAAKAALAIVYQAGDSALSVTRSLGLPTSGANAVSVAWVTTDSARINLAGTVTRPLLGQLDAPVTLTATLSRGAETDTKAFSLTVLASTSGSFTVAHDWDWTDFGISGASLYATVAVQEGDHIYVGTSTMGLLYSDNAGTSWAVKNYAVDGLSDGYVEDIVIAGDLVVIGTSAGLSVWNRGPTVPGIFRSLDGHHIYDVIVDGTELYLATGATIRHGTLSVAPTLASNATIYDHAEFLCLSGTTLYAAGNSDAVNDEPINVFDTTNWSASPTTIDVNDHDDFSVGPIWADGGAICLGINNSPWYSADGGVSFDYAQPVAGGTVTGILPMGSALLSVRYGSDIWLSLDSGANWTGYAVPGYDGFLGILANGVSYDGSEVLIAHNNGVVVGSFN